MRRLKLLILCGALMFALAPPVAAEPKGPNGEACDTSETNVKHDIGGKHYTCDKCVFSQCSTSGGSVSNCQKVTHWSNCVEAAGSGAGGPGRVDVNKMAPPNLAPQRVPPAATPRGAQ